jgi:hypothetical protein
MFGDSVSGWSTTDRETNGDELHSESICYGSKDSDSSYISMSSDGTHMHRYTNKQANKWRNPTRIFFD